MSTYAKDMMIPLSEYATVPVEATLHDAVAALEEAQAKHNGPGLHRSVLVLDDQRDVVGIIDQWEVLWALEPRYQELGDFKNTTRFGLYPEFVHGLMKTFDLLREPLDDLCRKASGIKVKDVMSDPHKSEFIEAGATINQAIHQMVLGHHLSLLVRKAGKVVGVLRLCDVFGEVGSRIKACGLK